MTLVCARNEHERAAMTEKCARGPANKHGLCMRYGRDDTNGWKQEHVCNKHE
jgi:hypothetical protein